MVLADIRNESSQTTNEAAGALKQVTTAIVMYMSTSCQSSYHSVAKWLEQSPFLCIVPCYLHEKIFNHPPINLVLQTVDVR